MLYFLLLLSVGQQAPVPPQAPSLERRLQVLEENQNNFEARLLALEKAKTTTQPSTSKSDTAIINSVVTKIPPGFHAHKTVDGRTVVHADTNFGDAVAHANIDYPWVKTAVGGQTITTSPSSSSCPTGGCPLVMSTNSVNQTTSSCPTGNCPTSGYNVMRSAPVYSNYYAKPVYMKSKGGRKCKNGSCPW